MAPLRYTQIPTPDTCECDLIWNEDLGNIIKLRTLKGNHSGLTRWALIPMTSVLILEEEKRRGDREKAV